MRGAAVHGAVFNISLSTQVVRVLNGCFHSLYGEERGQIGRVGGNENEREKGPCAAHYSNTRRLGVYVGALTKKNLHNFNIAAAPVIFNSLNHNIGEKK